MARLSAQADMEYVPSDLPTIRGLADRFHNLHPFNRGSRTVRLLDPCAGEGRALKALKDSFLLGASGGEHKLLGEPSIIQTYGVELDRKRAAQAKKNLDVVMSADFDNTLITNKRFSLILLNPPYDYDPDYKRLEQRFLVKATSLLINYGILIYIVPRYVLRTSALFLSQHYDDFTIWQADNPEAEKFDQVMLMAVRTGYTLDRPDLENKIMGFAEGLTDQVSDMKTYRLPFVLTGEVDMFTQRRLDYPAMMDAASRTGFETTLDWEEITDPPDNDISEPLMPTRTGHMGLIMAGGGAGGLGIPVWDDEASIVFKAKSSKVVEEVGESPESSVRRLAERMSNTVIALDTNTWHFEDDVDMAEFVSRWRQPLAAYISSIMPPRYTPQRLRELNGGPPDYRRLLRQPMPGNGQRLAIEGAMYSLLTGSRGTTVVGEMGTGKTFISMVAAYLAGKRRIFVVCPPTLVWKWEEEVLKTIPGAKVYVVGRKPASAEKRKHPFYQLSGNAVKQLEWLRQNYSNKDDRTPVFVVMAHSTAKLSYGRMPAVVWRWGYTPQPTYDAQTGKQIRGIFTAFQRVEKIDEEEAAHSTVETQKVQRMCCPQCLQPLVDKKGEALDFDKLYKKHMTCPNQITTGCKTTQTAGGVVTYETIKSVCGAPLWQAWTKPIMGRLGMGFPPRRESLRDRMFRKYCYGINVDYEEARIYGGLGSLHPDYQPDRGQTLAARSSSRAFSNESEPARRIDLVEYIKRHMTDWGDCAVMDEVHQFKSKDSNQGAMARMFADVVPQTMSLTGTLMAGYARDLFNILYAFGDRAVRRDFGHREDTRWCRTFGFVEKVIDANSDDNRLSRNKKPGSRARDLPGVMPSVLRYILPQAVFLRLQDVKSGLPHFNEYNISVELDDTIDPEAGRSQQSAYEALDTAVRAEIKSLRFKDSKAAQHLVSIYAQAVPNYPDACTQKDAGVVYSPADDSRIVNIPPLSADKRYPKEEKLLEIIKSEKEQGRKVLVFCTHTNKRDVMPRLQAIMEQDELQGSILRAETVDADKRMAWVDKELGKGLDALICHPQLVETGVDMLAFPTIVWYESDYNTARVRQASRRSWRIGQTEHVKIFYLTYADTKQTQALHLIANKVATSLAVEGDLSNDGLTALAGGDDMGRSIARMLVDDDTPFDGSFEAGINIAGIQENSPGETLLVENQQDWDLVDGEVEDEDDADGLVDDTTESLDDPECIAEQLISTRLAPADKHEDDEADRDESPQTGEYGAVSMDDWMSAFQVTADDLQLGRRKRRSARPSETTH